MIEFHDISLQIHGQQLIRSASLRVVPGDKLVLRGPSGCGKSSLLKATVGLFPLAAGSVRVDGLELDAGSAAQIRARIAYIGQEPVLGAETVREALLLPFTFKAHRHRNPPAEETLIQTLESLRLPAAILDKPAGRISAGERQRAAIARALLLGKKTFLADETTSALDPASKAAAMNTLFREGATLLSVSHDPDWIAACGRVVEIRDRRLRETGKGGGHDH